MSDTIRPTVTPVEPPASPTLSQRVAYDVSKWLTDRPDNFVPIGLVVYERYEGRFGVHALGWSLQSYRSASFTLGLKEARYLPPYLDGFKDVVPCHEGVSMAELPYLDQMTLLMATSVFNIEVKRPEQLMAVAAKTDVHLALDGEPDRLPEAFAQAALVRAAFGGAR